MYYTTLRRILQNTNVWRSIADFTKSLALLGLICLSTQSMCQNVVSNGDFEAGTADWTVTLPASIASSPANPNCGGAHLSIGDFGGIWQSGSASAGVTYDFNCDAYRDNSLGYAEIDVYWYDSGWNQIGTHQQIFSTTSWINYSQSLTAPAGTANFGIWAGGGNGAEFRVDCIELTAAPVTDFWFDAECSTVGSLWEYHSDVNASNDYYMEIAAGYTDLATPPSTLDSYLSFTFDVTNADNYYLFGRVIAPTGDDNSFWVRMDGGTWLDWHITISSAWTWRLFSGTPYTLSSGSHTLEIAYREDGTLLDKIHLSTSSTLPTGEGGISSNCSSEDCTNSTDDDGDGLIDCADSDCSSDPNCPAICNMVINGEFDNGTSNWVIDNTSPADATFTIDNTSQLSGTNSAYIDIINSTGTDWHTQFRSSIMSIDITKTYDISFEAVASGNKNIAVSFQQNISPYTTYSWDVVTIGTTPQTYSINNINVSATANDALFKFYLNENAEDIWLDNIKIEESGCSGVEICDNGLDDDGDLLVDCDDPDCANNSNCTGSSCDIIVRALGECGVETIDLQIDGVAVATFSLTTSFVNYTYNGYSGNGAISISFADGNTGCDHNVQIDYINVGTSQYQSETSASHSNSACNSGEWLWCAGTLEFGSLACSGTDLSNQECVNGKTIEHFASSCDGANNVSVAISNSSNISQTVLEIVYLGCDPGASITVNSSSGSLVLNKSGNSNNGGFIYKGSFAGGLSSVDHTSICGGCSQSNGLQSLIVYVVRDVDSGFSYQSMFVEASSYCDTTSFNLSIPTGTTTRDINLVVPITEITNDGRYLTVEAVDNSGAVSSSQTIYGPDATLGNCCLNVFELNLQNVPGSSTSLDINIVTDHDGNPNGSFCGQSWLMSTTVYAEIECGVEICDNNQDDDGDDDVDCADLDCSPVLEGVLPLNPACPSLTDGAIVITATGENLEYSINGGGFYQALNSFTGLPAGSYDVRVRNSVTGCFVDHTYNPILIINPSCGSCPNDFSVQVNAGSDDAEEDASGIVDLGSSDLELVEDGSVQEVGLRFNVVNIPQGAIISSAYIEFTTDEINDEPTSLIIYAEDIDNAVTFDNATNKVSTRTKTAGVPWTNVAPWYNEGEKQYTSDISELVQTVVDRSGWSSGNSMVFIINGSGKRVAVSDNQSKANSPKLVVNYCIGSPSCASSMLSNNDLENGLTDWNASSNISSSSDANGGLSAAYANGGEGGIFQNFAANEGDGFTLTAYAKENGTETSSITIKFFDASFNVLKTSIQEIEGNSYAEFDVSAVAPVSTAFVQFLAWKNMGSGETWWDDFCADTWTMNSPSCPGASCEMLPGEQNYLVTLDDTGSGNFWLDYDIADVVLCDNNDGTIQIKGNVVNGVDADWDSGVATPCGVQDGWYLDLHLFDKQTWFEFLGTYAENANCVDTHFDLDYWDVTGTFTGIGCNAGRTITVTGPSSGYRFQIGTGGNSNDGLCQFGMSTWFEAEENGNVVLSDFYGLIDSVCYRDIVPREGIDPNVCYLIADGSGEGHETQDSLYTFNPETGVTTAVGPTGAFSIEAMAIDLSNELLYSATRDSFGTISISTGTFTPIITDMGDLNGAYGIVDIDDIDGMTFDANNNIIWATHREVDGAPDDILLKIDPTTGLADPNGFGSGVGYVIVPTNEHDIDDIALDENNVLFAISNFGGSGNQRLGTINKTTGAFTEIGDYGIEDVEGLMHTGSGQMLATTGKSGDHQNALYSIDGGTGTASFIGSILPATDVEACVCKNASFTNLQIGDRVWSDINANGIQDPGESGVPNVTVFLLNGSGNYMLDASNNPIFTTTDAVGYYIFDRLAAGSYMVEFILPTGASFTSANSGGDDALDSDANSGNGRSGVVTLGNSTNDYDTDAGLINAGTTERVCLDVGDLLVADGSGNIIRYDSLTGVMIDTFIYGLNNPREMVVGSDNWLYVSDYEEDIIYRYSLVTGGLVDVVTTNVNNPDGMAFGSDGFLYVNGKSDDLVYKVDPSDGSSTIFVSSGSGGLDGNYSGIEFGPDGNLYVSSKHTDAVLRFNGTTGAFIDVFAYSAEVNAAVDITFGPDGNLYVAAEYNDKVVRFNGTTGAYIDNFVTYQSGNIDAPVSLSFGPAGDLYVTASSGVQGVYKYNGTTGAFISLLSQPSDPYGLIFAPVPDCDDLCELNPMTLDAGDQVDICVGSSTVITATVSGGNGILNYNWDNGLPNQASHSVSPTEETVYNVTVTDAEGCEVSDNVIVSLFSTLNGGAIGGFESSCGSFNPSVITSEIDASSGGAETIDYVWQQRDKSCGNSFGAWSDISGAVNASYDPGMINNSTQYRRGAIQPAACNTRSYTSPVTMEVVENFTDGGTIVGAEVGCTSYDPSEIVGSVDANGGCGGQSITYPFKAFTIGFAGANCGYSEYEAESDLMLSDNGDGTMSLTGTIADGLDTNWNASTCETNGCSYNDIWYIELTLTGKEDYSSFSGGGGQANVHANCTASVNDLDYWSVSGSLTGQGCNYGRTITVSQATAPYAMQIGYGGNNQSTTCEYSLSTWLVMDEDGTQLAADIYGNVDAPIYTWESREMDCVGNWSSWSAIVGATDKNYDPSIITKTTEYRRGALRAGCSADYKYSNIILKELNCLPSVDAGSDEGTCSSGNATITAVASGGSGVFTYNWDNSLGAGASHNVTPNATTVYSVTATDSNGCTVTDAVTISVNSAPTANAGPDVTICDGDLLTLTASGSGGSETLTFEWDNGPSGFSQTVSPSSNTSYVVSVSDENGCESTDVVNVDVNDCGMIMGNVSEDTNGASSNHAFAPPGFTIICHHPGTNSEQTKMVSDGSLASHLGHGDTMGPCAGIDFSGDAYLSGIPIALHLPDGSTELTNTDVDGNYKFENLAAGNYMVVQDDSSLGSTYIDVQDGDESDDGDGEDMDYTADDTINVILAVGEQDLNNDFVEEQIGTISGTVDIDVMNNNDDDGNGSDDDDIVADDMDNIGLGGVLISLIDNYDGSTISTFTTISALADLDGDGSNEPIGAFYFDNLRAGSYTLIQSQPAGYGSIYAFDESPDPDGTAAISNEISVILDPGEDDLDNYFLEEELGSIGDLVWFDEAFSNLDVYDDGVDQVMDGVMVKLMDEFGNVLLDDIGNEKMVMTSNGGKYLFDDLSPGNYRVSFYPSATYTMVNSNYGADDELDSDMVEQPDGSGMSPIITLATGEDNMSIDGGLKFPVVPISLLHFYGNHDENKRENYLFWDTDLEVNSDKFIIQRSLNDGDDFVEIGEVDAQGDVSGVTNYSFVDDDLESDGMYLYRLSQIDINGTSDLSKTIAIRVNSQDENPVTIYPNPAVDIVKLSINNDQESSFNFWLYTLDGREVLIDKDTRILSPGINEIDVDVRNVNSGSYIMRVEVGKNTSIKKLVIMK